MEQFDPVKFPEKPASPREAHERLQADAVRLEESMATLASEIETMNLLVKGLQEKLADFPKDERESPQYKRYSEQLGAAATKCHQAEMRARDLRQFLSDTKEYMIAFECGLTVEQMHTRH